MIVWIDRDLVLAIHNRQLAEHGGATGVRDEGLLQSALARHEQMHADGDPEPDLADLAAALAFGLARNHPFIDGNKRTAYVAWRAFLEMNGARLVADSDEKCTQMLALAEGKLPADAFASWLRAHLHGTRVQEPSTRYRAVIKPKTPRARRPTPARGG